MIGVHGSVRRQPTRVDGAGFIEHPGDAVNIRECPVTIEVGVQAWWNPFWKYQIGFTRWGNLVLMLDADVVYD